MRKMTFQSCLNYSDNEVNEHQTEMRYISMKSRKFNTLPDLNLEYMKTLIICIIFFQGIAIFQSTLAQTCVQEELFKLPGAWKPGSKGSVNNVSQANLAKEKEVIQSILSIFREAYSPKGCEVSYSGIYGYNAAYGKNWISDPYGLNAYFLRFLCDPENKDKHYVDISTPTNLDVRVNKFQLLPTEFFAAELSDDHETGFLMVSELPEYKSGYYFMEKQADYNNKIKTYTWIICYNDKLPYKHLTQREYLILKQAELKLKLDEINERVKVKKARGDEFTSEDIAFYDGQRDYYGKPIRLIDDLLQTKSASELESPAVIQTRGDLNPLPTLVELGTPHSDILIKPNPDYYNKKLPKYAPQLFSINLTISHGDPVFEDVFEKISKAVDIKIFKEMLGESFEPEKP